MVAEVPAPPPLGPLYATVVGGRLLRLTFDEPPALDSPQPPVPATGSGSVPGSGAGSDRLRDADGAAGIVAAVAEGVARWLATGDGCFAIPLDLDAVGEFRARVYRELCAVPAGERITYGELARRSERPGAARAVGRAMATNPWPLVIPCHRVVPAAGGVGNYAGGVGRKRWMLEVEAGAGGAPVAPAGGRPAQAGP